MFLYRFDVLPLDGLGQRLGGPNDSPARLSPGRLAYGFTDNEVPVLPAVGASTYAAPFLPLGVVWATGADGRGRFVPERITHDGIRYDGESDDSSASVSVPIDNPIAARFARDFAGCDVWLTLAEYDPAALLTDSVKILWVGRVAAFEYDEFRCTLKLDSLIQVLKATGLTARHPRQCPYTLFDASSCRVSPAALDEAYEYFLFREDGDLLTVSADGMTVTMSEAANRPDGWASGGVLVVGGEYSRESSGDLHYFPARSSPGAYADYAYPYPAVNGGFQRTVVGHVGNTLLLATPLPPGSYTTQAARRASLFAGCDSSVATCRTKFGNSGRYGGYPYIPIKNAVQVGLREAAYGSNS